MIKLIVGSKGSGKTKTIIDMMNTSAEATEGHIVCIEKGMKSTYNIKSSIRIIDVDDYKQTYKVVMDWSKKVEVSDGIIIRCATTKESKYPESHCESMYDNTEMANTFDEVRGLKDFPIVVDAFDFESRRAIHFEIRGAVLEDGSLLFSIVDYTGGLRETAMDVLQQKGYEFDGNATVNYYDMTDQYNDFPEQE